MQLSRKLNLVIPVERDDGSKVYVYSSPIRRELFQDHFFVISKTFALIYAGGLNWHTGPRVAYYSLKKIAEEMGVWPEVQASLLAEVHRTTMVSVPGQGQMLWDEAVNKKILSDDDQDEVMNSICFFIVNSAMLKKSQAKGYLESAASMWDAEITSLDFTAYLASLQTSKGTESSGEKKTS